MICGLQYRVSDLQLKLNRRKTGKKNEARDQGYSFGLLSKTKKGAASWILLGLGW